MAEQIGEGFFVDKRYGNDVREGRELIEEYRRGIGDIKALIELGEELLLDSDNRPTGEIERLETQIEKMKSDMADEAKSKAEVEATYDRLYAAVHGRLPN